MNESNGQKKFVRNFFLSEFVGFGFGVPLATLYGLTLEPELMGAALSFILLVTAVIVIFIAYPMNFFIARKRSRFLQDFHEGSLSDEEIVKGFFSLIRLPVMQSLLIFIRISLGLIVVVGYMHLYLEASLLNLISTLIFAFFGIYITAIVNYLIIFLLIDKPLKDIVAGGYIKADMLHTRGRRHFGIGFRTRTLLFMLVPVLVGYINILFLNIFYLSESSFFLYKGRLIQMIVINIASFFIGFLALYITENRVINNLLTSIETLAGSGGDLTQRIPTTLEDEFSYISYRINSVFRNFSGLVYKLKTMADQGKTLAIDLEQNSTKVSGTVEQITGAVMSFKDQTNLLDREISNSNSGVIEIRQLIVRVTKRIEDQSASVTESSASVEETMASIRNLTKMAEERAELVDKLSKLSGLGEGNMDEMLLSIEEITKSAGTIQGMMDVINSVANQTNLLAMNAAIEAAHAGEAGKGFAVVADEIRKLSEATSSNARSISNSLTSIIDSIEKTANLSKETGSSINQITGGIKVLANSISEMVLGMQEISGGSNEVIQALNNLVGITEDVRNSSREMDGLAGSIEDSMKKLAGISEKNSSDVGGIGNGLDNIKESMNGLSDLGTKNFKNFTSLDKEISKFGVEDEQLKLFVEKDDADAGSAS